MSCPLDYSLCNQVVTVYRLDHASVSRQVVENAWYSWECKQVTDELGKRQETLFSLIVPGECTLLPGDRVYDGIGPEITAKQWAGFLPVTVPGLGEIQYVRPCCWQGTICHTEAGRK